MTAANPKLWKIAYGLLYGGVVAGAYLFVRLVGRSQGLHLFFAISVGMFTLHLILWPKEAVKGLLDKGCWFRGLFYGLTQVMLIKGQEIGLTTTTLVASAIGGVFATVLARGILKEKATWFTLTALLFCTASIVVDPRLLFGSVLALLGGITQGTGFFLSRYLMLKGTSIRSAISSGFAFAALVAGTTLLFRGNLGQVTAVPFKDILLGMGVGFVVQYGFFYLYAIVDTHRAVILTYSRLPWSLGLEHWIAGTPVLLHQLASCLMVGASAILLVFETNRKTRKL